jgi:hypothetical protein
VFSEFGVDRFAPSPLHPDKRPLLVGAHHPEMTGDVRGENYRRRFHTLVRGICRECEGEVAAMLWLKALG